MSTTNWVCRSTQQGIGLESVLFGLYNCIDFVEKQSNPEKHTQLYHENLKKVWSVLLPGAKINRFIFASASQPTTPEHPKNCNSPFT